MKTYIKRFAIFMLSLFAVCHLQASENRIQLLQPAMLKLQTGVDQMVASGKSLLDWKQNRAILTYIELQERFEQRKSDILYQHIISPNERACVDTLWSRIVDSDEYFNAYDKATDEQTETSWQKFKTIVAQQAMKLLIEKGVKFQPNPSKDTHKDFLMVNHAIDGDSQQWLVPGSIILYVSQQIQDSESGIFYN